MSSSSQHESQACKSIKIQTNPLDFKKKRVSFACNARVKLSLHIDDYTEEEVRAIWYSKGEFATIRNEIRDTIELIMSNKPMKKGYLSRGLEFRTPQLSCQRKQNKLVARNAVLNEQRAQFDSGICDEERIAIVYQQSNYHCRMTAIIMGAADEKAVSSMKKQHHCTQHSHRRNNSSGHFQTSQTACRTL